MAHRRPLRELILVSYPTQLLTMSLSPLGERVDRRRRFLQPGRAR